MIIGIEGPAGAGKTTMARAVAPEFDAVVIEGGAWYRGLTYTALVEKVDLHDTEHLCSLAGELALSVLPDTSGATRLLLRGNDVTDQLADPELSKLVPEVAQQLVIREIIEPQIVNAVRAQPHVIVVGRHMKKALPEACVLRIRIDEAETNRRHAVRTGDTAASVTDRNIKDAEIAQKLGVTADGVTELDVTHMSKAEQADALRQFIIAAGI